MQAKQSRINKPSTTIDNISNKSKSPSQQLIHEIIISHGYSKSKLARTAGISRKTLMNIYSGHTLEPNHQTFRRLLGLYCQLFYPIQK